MNIMIDVVGTIRAAEEALTANAFVHSGTSSPSSDKGFKQTHANIGLTEPKDMSQIFVPLARKH